MYSGIVTPFVFPLCLSLTENVAVLPLGFASFHNWTVPSLHNPLSYTDLFSIPLSPWMATHPRGEWSRTPRSWSGISYKLVWLIHNKLEEKKRNYPKRWKEGEFKKLLCTYICGVFLWWAERLAHSDFTQVDGRDERVPTRAEQSSKAIAGLRSPRQRLC